MSAPNHPSIILRPAQRADIPALARIANAANAQSAIHRRIAPKQEQYPSDYYLWRLNIIRQRFATPSVYTIVAVDASTSQILGQASWGLEGHNEKFSKSPSSFWSDTIDEDTSNTLAKTWTDTFEGWFDALDRQLLRLEKFYTRYTTFYRSSLDYTFLNKFLSIILGSAGPLRPSCLHCHMITVDPGAQRSRGVGRALIDWGKQKAVQEGLPVYLESNLEATGFYEKGGFKRLGVDIAVPVSIDGVKDGESVGEHGDGEMLWVPAYVWEGQGREGRWLEKEKDNGEEGERWKWREDVLPPSKR